MAGFNLKFDSKTQSTGALIPISFDDIFDDLNAIEGDLKPCCKEGLCGGDFCTCDTEDIYPSLFDDIESIEHGV